MNPASKPLAPPAAPPNRRRIAANFVTLAGTGIAGLLVTVLISVYVRRVLGPTAVGQVSWALAAVTCLTVVVNPGLTTIGQRDVARDPARSQRLFALVLTLQTLLAVVAFSVVWALAALDLRGRAVGVLLLIQGGSLFLSAWNAGWVLQAHERMVGPSIVNLLLNVLQIPLLLFLIHTPEDLYLYALVSLVYPLLVAVYGLSYLCWHRVIDLTRLRPTLAGTGALLSQSWPLALAQVAILVHTASGTLILGFTHSDDTVGQYATAHRLMMVAAVVIASLWNAYFPVFSRAQDAADATQLSREYARLLAWIGMPMAVLGWAFGKHIVVLMYGPAFAAAGAYFEWLCPVIAISCLNYGLVSTLVPWGHNLLQLKITAAAAAINLAIALVGIPHFGAWGAIAAGLVAETAALALGLAARRRYGIYWHPVISIIVPPLLCALAVVFALAALPRRLDVYWWLELPAAGLVLLACTAAIERRAVGRALRGLFRGHA